MASINAKAVRKADALRRLSSTLNITQADLHATARGDAELATIVTLERLADAVERNQPTVTGDNRVKTLREAIRDASDDELIAIPGIGEKSLEALREWAAQEEEAQEPTDEQPPVTVETVEEEPLQTTETVEIVPTEEVPDEKAEDKSKPKKGKPGTVTPQVNWNS
jgi:hypothetical protein